MQFFNVASSNVSDKLAFKHYTGADSGYLERGFICMKGCGGGGGFTLMILSHFS